MRPALAVVRSAFEAIERGDASSWLAHLDPNVRVHTPRGVTSGHEAALRFARGDPGSELTVAVKLLDLTTIHDWIVVTARLTTRWRESGEVADETTALAVCRVGDGLIASVHPIR